MYTSMPGEKLWRDYKVGHADAHTRTDMRVPPVFFHGLLGRYRHVQRVNSHRDLSVNPSDLVEDGPSVCLHQRIRIGWGYINGGP